MNEMKVEYIDHMGDDNSIVNAARVSFTNKLTNLVMSRTINLFAI